jgi:hypothetical protein
VATQSGWWLTRREAADLLEVSLQQFERTYQVLLPKSAIRMEGRKYLIRGRALVDAIVSKELAKTAPGEDAEVYAGGDSPNLERLRLAKAKLAEFEVARQERRLIPIDEHQAVLMALASRLRSAGEALQVKYGVGAAADIEEALERFGGDVEGAYAEAEVEG